MKKTNKKLFKDFIKTIMDYAKYYKLSDKLPTFKESESCEGYFHNCDYMIIYEYKKGYKYFIRVVDNYGDIVASDRDMIVYD